MIRMKLFVGNDYTFCMSEDCDKKESCVRWKGHYEKADGFDLRAYVMSCDGSLYVDGRSVTVKINL